MRIFSRRALTCTALAYLVPLWACGQAEGKEGFHGSPHEVLSIGVEPGVTLEVLDWGGEGDVLLFLAGFGNSAHVFDDFAPRFRSSFRVMGLTRRGFGRSSLPATGYDNARLVADVVAVMDSLQIQGAILVAHSFGGAELNGLATHQPDRVRGLIYLDGGFDFAELYGDSAWVSTPIPRPARGSDHDGSPAAEAAYMSHLVGPGYPESEVRASAFASAAQPAPGFSRDSLATWLMRGTPRITLSDIPAPVLAIYGVPATVEQKYPWYSTLPPAERSRADRRFEVEATRLARQRARFRSEVSHARVLEIAGGRHYIFLTHPTECEGAIRSFAKDVAATRGAGDVP